MSPATAAVSALSLRMNLSRAGVLKNRSRTEITVPSAAAAASTVPGTPPSRRSAAPSPPA